MQIPVAIIHGHNDEMVPFSHGQALLAKAPNTLPPCWLSRAGHNDVPLRNTISFLFNVNDIMMSKSEYDVVRLVS